ncbi:MAG: homoserine dehydrogenase [Clostridiales bacterium]|nr:homoserine dehydrogenase [Clostridiales bacterium]
MNQTNIALLGFGVVGSGVYRILTENHDDLNHREVLDLHVTRILIRDAANVRDFALAPQELFTADYGEILNDDSISIVVECMGGVEPARSFILQALRAGKSVVSSNKEVISKHWHEFDAEAKARDAGLYYEATVGGGIPILRTIMDSMQANNITRVMGIINGTTNYILTKMSEEGLDFDEVLHEAQSLGYAETDSTADVEGYDATYKLSILASLAFHAHLPVSVIPREGITKLSRRDFAIARQLGYEIKLLAIGKKHGSQIEVHVHPTMLPKTHPLAAVRGVFNAIFLTGHAANDIMLYGRGAGSMPTASAVVSDIICAVHRAGRHRYITFANAEELSTAVQLLENYESRFCARLLVEDAPGVLASVAGVLAKHNVSLRSVLQPGESDTTDARLTLLTHNAAAQSVRAALAEIAGLSCVRAVESLLHVEE